MELIKNKKNIFNLKGQKHLTIKIAAKGVNHIDYSNNDDTIRKEEKSLISKITDIKENNIIMLNQVHRDNIVVIDTPPNENQLYIDNADGMITNVPKLCLVIRTADCVPIFAFDDKKQIFGIAHSGWRGCSLSIGRKLIQGMKKYFGSKYKDINIIILPSIGPESYSVNNDVATLFKNYISIKNNQFYLNLWENIESSLKNEGIPIENIFQTKICTLINKKEFFSHRGKDSGRNLNFGYIL